MLSFVAPFPDFFESFKRDAPSFVANCKFSASKCRYLNFFFSVFDHVYVEKQNACTSPAATLLCVNCGFTVVSKVT